MLRIPIDDELRARFRDFQHDIELYDKDGKVLARFLRSTPWSDPEDWEPLTPEISQEEIERRLAEGGPTFTTAQLIDELRKLDVSP
jgi:hypothetical protein